MAKTLVYNVSWSQTMTSTHEGSVYLSEEKVDELGIEGAIRWAIEANQVGGINTDNEEITKLERVGWDLQREE